MGTGGWWQHHVALRQVFLCDLKFHGVDEIISCLCYRNSNAGVTAGGLHKLSAECCCCHSESQNVR